MMGWSVDTPLAWTIAPTTNGKLRNDCIRIYTGHKDEDTRKDTDTYMAAPEPPRADAKPIAATCSSGGSNFAAAIMAAGKKGPMK